MMLLFWQNVIVYFWRLLSIEKYDIDNNNSWKKAEQTNQLPKNLHIANTGNRARDACTRRAESDAFNNSIL